MSGLSKLTRALASATLVGLLAAGAVATTHPGSPPRIAPPCSPDGNCIPNRFSFGMYQTHWRPFPGDTVGITPTKAEGEKAEEGEEGIGGPQLPTPAEEGQSGPKPRTPSSGGAAAPVEGAIPGEVPFDPLQELSLVDHLDAETLGVVSLGTGARPRRTARRTARRAAGRSARAWRGTRSARSIRRRTARASGVDAGIGWRRLVHA